MPAFFVTATGTDIGKTFVTSGLIKFLHQRGHPVAALKPVASGYEKNNPAASDAGQLLAALGREITEDNVAAISPWRYAAPLSPDMAAAREGRSIDYARLVAFSREPVARAQGTLFIEGIGGVMVPLDRTHTTLDWMADLGLPLIMVTGSYLGSMSHTLTAAAAVKQRGLRIAALVVNETPGSPVDHAETAQNLAARVDAPSVMLPHGAVASHAGFAALEALVSG
jgi:dethiobiotin synthetase